MRSARSSSSLMAMMPRCARGMSPKWMVSGITQAAAFGDLHRVDVTDEVGDQVSGVAGFSL